MAIYACQKIMRFVVKPNLCRSYLCVFQRLIIIKITMIIIPVLASVSRSWKFAKQRLEIHSKSHFLLPFLFLIAVK